MTQDCIYLFSSFGYQKLISKPTRVVKEGCTIKSSMLIDNIYTNINDWNDGISGVLHSDDVIGNDHKIIFYIRTNSALPKFKKKQNTKRLLSKKCVLSLKVLYIKNGKTYMNKI